MQDLPATRNCFTRRSKTSDLLQAARDLGHVFHLLSKPVHPTELLRKIRKHEHGI
jgi:hypothetical protein